MKKDVLVVITIILFILGSGYGLYAFLNMSEVTTDPRAEGNTPTISQLEDAYIEVPVATVRTEDGSDPTLGYTYRLSYPEIALLGHPTQAKETNAVIKTFAEDILNAFERDIKEMDATRTKDSPTSDLTMLARPTLLSPTIISLRFDVSEYVTGSAHPTSNTRIFNYDIEGRRLLGIEDIFASSSEALFFLSEFSRVALHAKFTDLSEKEWDDSVLEGTTPVPENFSTIALKKDGLLVIFDPYQVASYARGAQEVFIPLDTISPILTSRTKDAMRLSGENFVEAVVEKPLQMEQ